MHHVKVLMRVCCGCCRYDTSADIWSFGITLIELAHGRPPLARMHPMRVLMDTMSKPPPQLGGHPSGTQFSKVRVASAALAASW